MESKNIFQKNTCNVQQIAVISKIHNMQWLKNNPALPGHIKPKTNKGIINALTEDLKTSGLTTESTMSVPNITANDNVPLVSSTNITSTTNNNPNCDIENKMDEKFNVLENMESTLDVEESSSLSFNVETQAKLEEEENYKGHDTRECDSTECDLTLTKIKDFTSEVTREKIQDNNNNDKLNITSEPDLQIKDIRSDTLLSKGADKEDQSNNVCSSKETDTLLNLKNSNDASVANDDAAVSASSVTFKTDNELKEESKCQVKQLLGKKEVPKVITKNVAPTSTVNKKNNITLGQSTESKTKYGIKQSIKNLSAEVVKKTPDKKNQEPSQSMSNTSKILRNKSNLQPKKESVIIKPSPEYTARHNTKNLKESEQNKTSLNSVNKQYKINRMCYTLKKEESGSMSKINTYVSKPMQHTVKEVTNCSNSSNSAQSIHKQLMNTTETLPIRKKILQPSDAASKYNSMEQKVTLKNDELTETLTSKEECENRSGDMNKIFVNIIDKGINTPSNEIKESNESNITNLTNECVKPKQTNTNPFLTDISNLSISKKPQTDAKDFKNIPDNNLNIKSTQLDNVSPSISYVCHVPQQNAQQEQIPSHQNFIHYIPDQFSMDCSVNTALPKFHNTPYANGNIMQLGQYGNIQTMPNVPSGAQLRNRSSPNVLPPSAGNTNTLQYQLPNVLSCNPNVIRPPSNFCIHPMSQEEQFNLPPYGLNPPYFINPICVCRNDGYPLHPQNWNLHPNYPVPLQQNPYHINYNSLCNQHVQSNNMIHKNIAAARPLQNSSQVQILHERNVQRNYGKPAYSSGCYTRNPQNNKIYDTKSQIENSIRNTRDSIDVKIEKQDGEFLIDKESNNLPMISPKACMIYGSGLSKNSNIVRPQTKHSGTIDSISNCHLQYQKNNESYCISKAHLPSNIGMGRGKTQPNQPSYKAQY